MPVSEVTVMIEEALRAMGVGISGVFLVLLVFYGALRLMMARINGKK